MCGVVDFVCLVWGFCFFQCSFTESRSCVTKLQSLELHDRIGGSTKTVESGYKFSSDLRNGKIF